MIENHVEALGIGRLLIAQMQRIISTLNVDDPLWRKVDELLEMTFYQTQIEMHSLQDSMDRLREQLRVISSLQNGFVSATHVQTIILHAHKLILKYTEIELAAL